MKIEKFELHSFEGEQEKVGSLEVPAGSKFLGLKIIYNSIVAWYLVPEIKGNANAYQIENFIIVKPEEVVPDNAEFVTLLDTIIERPGEEGQIEEGLIIFPIFKLKN